MGNVVDDVKDVIAFSLLETRQDILNDCQRFSIEQIVDKAISRTVNEIEDKFELKCKAVVNSDGSDLWINEISKTYFDMVNDTGE